MPPLSVGTTAPDFQLAACTGGQYSLPEGLAGGTLLLAFFKVSCPTCQFTFPHLERLHQQRLGKGARIWGIVQGNAAEGTRFANTFSITFPILVDDSPYKVSRAYRLDYVPSLFLVQPNGRIEVSSEGFSKADLLAIQKSLAQSPAATLPALFLPAEKIPEFKPG